MHILFFPVHASSRCLVAVVEVVSCVDANANPGRQRNSTYCPLYRGRTKNIISRHKWRCHGVHQCEPCLNIQFLPCTWGGSFDVYGRDFMSWAKHERRGWLQVEHNNGQYRLWAFWWQLKIQWKRNVFLKQRHPKIEKKYTWYSNSLGFTQQGAGDARLTDIQRKCNSHVYALTRLQLASEAIFNVHQSVQSPKGPSHQAKEMNKWVCLTEQS